MAECPPRSFNIHDHHGNPTIPDQGYLSVCPSNFPRVHIKPKTSKWLIHSVQRYALIHLPQSKYLLFASNIFQAPYQNYLITLIIEHE